MKFTLSFRLLNKKTIVWLFLFILPFPIFSQLVLPSVISDGMILQQKTNASLWGKSKPGSIITISTSWDDDKYSVKVNADSTWRLKVPTPAASYDKHSITISYGQKKVLKDVLIGEVWLCSGQSNMYMIMKGIYANNPNNKGMWNDILRSKDATIRFYRVPQKGAITPQFSCEGEWLEASPKNTQEFSATAYYFASLLKDVLDVPIGVLSSCRGASKIEAWISPEAITPLGKAQPTEVTKDYYHKPSTLFNAMISPILGYNIKGVLWYQGESNIETYKEYPLLFKTMHNDWIKKWDNGVFPIYFAQLAPFDYNKGKTNDNYCALFREIQTKIADNEPNTEMISLMDIGEKDCIHPSGKRVTGERFTHIALAETYKYNIDWKTPKIDSWKVENDEIKMFFLPKGRLATFDSELKVFGFEIAGKDQVFYPAEAYIERDHLRIWAENVPQPIAIRYCFKDFAKGNLYAMNGMPFSSFRTDDWDHIK